MLPKNKKSRLILSLNLNNCEYERSHKAIPQLCNYSRPILSTKHSRITSKKLSFESQRLSQNQKKQKKLKLLAQKQELLDSLNALKGGAILAITQKQEQIELLRSQLNSDEVNDLSQRFSQLIADKKQLTEETKNLEDKLKSERQSYMRLLEQKDLVIEQLYAELQSYQLQLEKLQKQTEMKEKQINIISQQNQHLLRQLEKQNVYKITYHIRDVQINNTYKGQQFQNQDLAETGYFIENSSQQSVKKQFPSHMFIKEYKNTQEIQDLTEYLQGRINGMQQIYDKILEPSQLFPNKSLNNLILEEAPSLKQTAVNPEMLNKQLINVPNLSDCYSLTKKFQSKPVSIKDLIVQKGTPNSFKFLKIPVVNCSNYSRTSTNIKQQNKTCSPVSKKDQLDTHNIKTSEKSIEKKACFNMSSFILGVLTGGSSTLLLTLLAKR